MEEIPPSTALHLHMSKAVEEAQKLEKGSINKEYSALMAIYISQVARALVEAQKP